MKRASLSMFLTLLLLLAAAGVHALAGGPTLDVESIHGTVTSIDRAGGTFTIQPERGEVVTLHVDEHTKFVREGREISFEDLATDVSVAVNYERDTEGRLVALTVGVQ